MTHVITALTWQKRNKNRINVDLDGKYAFGISCNLASPLSIGKEISDEDIDKLCKLDQYEIAYSYMLRLLSYRIRSTDELRVRLQKKGFDHEITETTINRLIEKELISDHKFAQEWVENRSAFRPRSQRLLKFELRQKGVSDEIIDQALKIAQDDELLAVKAGRKYAARLCQLEYEKFRSRLSGFLLRRGFNYAIVNNVVSKIWNEIDFIRGK